VPANPKVAEDGVHSRRHEELGAIEHFVGAIAEKIPAADEAHDEKKHGKKREEHVERNSLRLGHTRRPYAAKRSPQICPKVGHIGQAELYRFGRRVFSFSGIALSWLS
jgi:hypothetical protein